MFSSVIGSVCHSELSNVCSLDFVYTCETHCDVSLVAQRIVGWNSQKSVLDIFRHPAASGMLHFTYFLLDISSGTLNRMVVCVMEYRVCVGNNRIIKSLGMSLDILAGFVGSLQPELQSLLTGVLSSVCTSVRLQVCLKL